jgi:hypothetical protein
MGCAPEYLPIESDRTTREIVDANTTSDCCYCLDLGPSTGDVTWSEDDKGLATSHDSALYLSDTRRSPREVTEVYECFEARLLDTPQQFSAHPVRVVGAVGDEDVEIETVFVGHAGGRIAAASKNPARNSERWRAVHHISF